MAMPAEKIKAEMAKAWGDKVHRTALRGPVPVPTVRPGGLTDTLLTVASEVAAEAVEAAVEAALKAVGR